MHNSESIKELTAALVAVQAEFKPVEQRGVAGGARFTYKYATLDDILSAVLPILSKHGIAVMQDVNVMEGFIFVETILLHTSGEWTTSTISAEVIADPRMNAMQSLGSQITYLRRYGLSAKINIASDQDTDAGELEAPNETTKTVKAASRNSYAVQDKEGNVSIDTAPEKPAKPPADKRPQDQADFITNHLVPLLQDPVFTDKDRAEFKRQLPAIKSMFMLETCLKTWQKLKADRKPADAEEPAQEQELNIY